MSILLDYRCLLTQVPFNTLLIFIVQIPIHRAQNHRSSVITSKVIAVFKFDLDPVAALLDLCCSRILPRVDTPARAGSDIYSILPIQNHQKTL